MKSNSTIFIIITALALAAGAYWFFFTGDGNDAPLTAGIEQDNQVQEQFRALVSELEFTLDTTIFSDPKFIALTDLATQVTPEDSGRPDPFAPILGISVK